MPGPSLTPEHRSWVRAHLKYVVFRDAFCPQEALDDALTLQAVDVQALLAILKTRYLNPRIPVLKKDTLSLAWQYILTPSHHDRFIQLVRISPTAFDVLLDLI
jgi:hypothetical protein